MAQLEGLGVAGSKHSFPIGTGEKVKTIDAGRSRLRKFLWLLLISSSANFLSASVKMKKREEPLEI